MILLLLTACGWLMIGFFIARYVLHQHTWFDLIPSSAALGFILHTLTLNLLLYVTNTTTAFWLSWPLLLGIGIGARWTSQRLSPTELGLSIRQFALGILIILIIAAGTLPPMIADEYYDNFHHYAVAGVIAHSGDHPLHPFSPESCAFYHYGLSLMGGVLFSVSGAGLNVVFDFITFFVTLTVLWMLVVVARRLNPNVWVGLLAMGLFFTYNSANWLAFPLTFEPVREATDSIGALDYYREVVEAVEAEGYRFGTLSFNSFTWVYNRVLHMRNISGAVLCLLLVLYILLTSTPNDRTTTPRWLLMGVLLGGMPLFMETLWPVALLTAGLVALYALWKMDKKWVIGGHIVLVLALNFGLSLFQGGVLTDTLFCQEKELGDNEGQTLTDIAFPAGPGYFAWYPPNEYIDLSQTENWPRWLPDWGIILLCYPFLAYYYLVKRRDVVASSLLIAGSCVAFGFLLVKFEYIGKDTSRTISNVFWVWAFLAADWLYSLWQKRGLQRFAAVIILPTLIIGGVHSYLTQMTSAINNAPEKLPASLVSEIDREVQKDWFGEIGTVTTYMLDMSVHYRVPMVFGNISVYQANRSTEDPMPIIAELRRYPDPDELRNLKIAYIYVDENALTTLSEAGRELLLDATQFEEVFRVERGAEIRILYRVVDQP